MNKKIVGILVIILVVVGLGIYFLNRPASQTPTIPPSPSSETNPSPATQQMPSDTSGNLPQNNIPTPPVATPSQPQTISVSISNFSFNPSSLMIKRGTEVVWTNNDSVAHTVTADSGTGPASAPINPGSTYSYTFNSIGIVAYHCSIHPSMHGQITVTQ